MEKTIYSVLRGGEIRYSAPEFDVLDIAVEKGFMTSPGNISYGGEGEAGSDSENNSYGEF